MRPNLTVVALTLLAAMAFAGPSNAATVLAATGTPLSEMIQNSHGADADGNLLTFSSSPSGYLIDYSSSNVIHYNGNSGGFAEVTGPGAGGGVGFADLTIIPETVTFSAFKFNLNLPAAVGSFNPPNGYQTDFTFGTTVFFSGGGSQMFNIDAGNGSGENRWLITAGAGEAIDKILFSDLVGVSTKMGDPTLTNSYNFDSIRQASFDISPVPEPSTWIMFILGFGFIGAVLRAARNGRDAAPQKI